LEQLCLRGCGQGEIKFAVSVGFFSSVPKKGQIVWVRNFVKTTGNGNDQNECTLLSETEFKVFNKD
jgi:hypothetical protein